MATNGESQHLEDVLVEALSADDKLDALKKAGAIAQSRAIAALAYYERSVGNKRLGARALRIAALGLGTLAGLTPLVLPMLVVFVCPSLAPHIKDLLSISALLAGMSVGCIAFDKLFGFSSAWMRFITAQMDLRAKIDAFSIDWARECLRAGPTPSTNQVLASLDVLEAFLGSINDVVRNETQSWVAEFRSVLVDLEKSIEAARSAASATVPVDRGAIEVRVLDVATLDERTWKLQLGSEAPSERVGAASAVATHITPGNVRVAVTAQVSGKPVSVERAVNVEPGKVAMVEMTLKPAPSDAAQKQVAAPAAAPVVK